MTMINSKPRHARNDLLPEMKLQTLAIADLTMPKRMVRKLDQGHIKEVANGIQAMGFSGDQGRARRRRRHTSHARFCTGGRLTFLISAEAAKPMRHRPDA
jgi:hypothetical protein